MTSRRYIFPSSCRVYVYIFLVLTDVLIRDVTVSARGRNTATAGTRHPQIQVKTAAGSQSTVAPPSERDDMEADVTALKSSLLKALGLNERPKSTSRQRITVPDYMWQLYRHQQLTNKQRHTASGQLRSQRPPHYYGNTIRSFTPVVSIVQQQYGKEKRRQRRSTSESFDKVRLHFNVSDSLADDLLYGAELRLFQHPARYRRDLDRQTSKRYKVSVYQVIQRDVDDADNSITRLLDTRTVNDVEWLSLDVTPAVSVWKSQGSRANHGLEIQVTTSDGQPVDVEQHVRLRRSAAEERLRQSSSNGTEPSARRSQGDVQTTSEQPVLVTYADDSRTRRAASSSKRRRRTRKPRHSLWCKRRHLYVDFAEVEWNDWIIAPPGYQAYVCHGVCPMILPDHLNATNHAQVQSLLHSVNRRLVPPACCVPTELSQISMLYVDEREKVVLRNYKDMVIEACGCR